MESQTVRQGVTKAILGLSSQIFGFRDLPHQSFIEKVRTGATNILIEVLNYENVIGAMINLFKRNYT